MLPSSSFIEVLGSNGNINTIFLGETRNESINLVNLLLPNNQAMHYLPLNSKLIVAPSTGGGNSNGVKDAP